MERRWRQGGKGRGRAMQRLRMGVVSCCSRDRMASLSLTLVVPIRTGRSLRQHFWTCRGKKEAGGGGKGAGEEEGSAASQKCGSR